MRRAAVVALLVQCLVGAMDGSAHAQTCGAGVGGSISDGRYTASGQSSPCNGSVGGATGGGLQIIRRTQAEPNLCPSTPDGRRVYVTVLDSSGAVISVDSFCEGPLVPGDPGVPLPPAPESVFREAPLPLPEVHTSPPGRGLVGFETWLWWGADTELAPLSVGIAGWTATVTPQLERVEWDLGNGDVVVGDGAGSEERPSARYVYAEHCDCTITVTATWGGTVTLSHPLLGAPITQTVTGVGFSASLPYEVVQRQAVIVQ